MTSTMNGIGPYMRCPFHTTVAWFWRQNNRYEGQSVQMEEGNGNFCSFPMAQANEWDSWNPNDMFVDMMFWRPLNTNVLPSLADSSGDDTSAVGSSSTDGTDSSSNEVFAAVARSLGGEWVLRRKQRVDKTESLAKCKQRMAALYGLICPQR